MKSKLLLLIFLLAIGGSASAQLALFICSPQLPCPGFPLGSVQAAVDQNGWRHFKLTLTQNVTLFSFVGTPPPAQGIVNVIFTQDATGGRTVTFASNISNPCTITATASSTTLCQFEFDGTTGIWIGISSGGTPGAPSGSVQINNSGVFGSITNVASGSVLASNGVSSTPIFQSKPVLDLRDISGIDCTGSTSSSSTLASLFFQGTEYTLPAGLTGCALKLAATVQPASTGAWAMHGFGGSGGFGSPDTITCTMTGTPCLWFDRQRDSDFGQLNINVGSASVGLQISQLSTSTGQISTNNHWHDMYISNVGASGSGILIGPANDTGSNNELQTFTNIGLFGPVTPGGTGFNIAIPLPNCRSLGLDDVTANQFNVGYAFGCGSMHMIGGLLESNNLDFSGNLTNHNLGGGFIAQTHSENGKQWLANFATANPFGFLFNRNEMNNPDLTKFQWDLSLNASTFITMGNFWGPNNNITKMVTLSTQGGSWVSIGDVLPNTTRTSLPDLSHTTGSAVNISTNNRYNSVTVISNGANSDLGADNGISGIFLMGNDSSDGGSNQSFYTSPGFDISAVFINASATKVFVPWRFVVTGQAPTGNNPTAQLLLKIDNDPMTGAAPATTGALSMDFTGGVQNGGILKLPATSHTAIANATGLQIFNTTTTCTTAASVGATCTTAAISLPVAAADTSYRITCTGKGPTQVPTISSIANSSASQFTITIAALTAVAASYSSFDCIAGHN